MSGIHYKAGEVIFREGYPADNAYIIVEGEVEIYNEGLDGVEWPLAMLGAGQMFGELGLIDEKPRSASARAKTDVVLQVMPI